MKTKNCAFCKKVFHKKDNYSKNYWETAKYCSIKCGRAVNNPRTAKPNRYDLIEWDGKPEFDIVVMYIEKDGVEHKVLIDRKKWEAPEICNYRWSLSNGYPSRRVQINGKSTTKPIHWFITPNPAKGFVVDHINGDKLDNTMSNLRELPHRLNIANQRIKNIYGAPGVRKTKSGKYHARIKHKGKEINLGRFPTVNAARQARIQAERKYWGISFTEEKI